MGKLYPKSFSCVLLLFERIPVAREITRIKTYNLRIKSGIWGEKQNVY